MGTYKVEIKDEYGCVVTPKIVEVLSNIESISDNKNIIIYPTITYGIVNVTLNDPLLYNSNLEIYNLIGVKIDDFEFNNSPTIKLDLSSYTKGAYIIKIISGNNTFYQKIILR